MKDLIYTLLIIIAVVFSLRIMNQHYNKYLVELLNVCRGELVLKEFNQSTNKIYWDCLSN